MAIITTSDDRRYQTANFGKTVGAVLVGSGAYTATVATQLPFANFCLDKMSKIGQSCDSVVLNKGVDKALENFKLPSKGVGIIGVNANTPTNPVFDKFPKWLKSILNPMVDIKAGRNAAFDFSSNQIFVNREKLGVATFHEMGHAVNCNFSKFWKFMQGLRLPCFGLGGLLVTVALFKRKKVEGEEPNGFFDKTTTFIKNNIGKLTLATFVPIVAEELMATYRGNKMAKKVLSPELFQKVQKTNRFGAATYITSAIAVSLAAVIGSKVRDAIAKPKEIAD